MERKKEKKKERSVCSIQGHSVHHPTPSPAPSSRSLSLRGNQKLLCENYIADDDNDNDDDGGGGGDFHGKAK